MLTLTRTIAFRSFQRAVGDCTLHINTAFVGTELIARGATKPDDLEIKWHSPKSPRTFVEKTRALLHIAMIGHVYTSLDQYLRDLSSDAWISLQDRQRNVLRKAITKQDGGAYSISDRFNELSLQLDPKNRADELLVKVLAVWRNKLVHEKKSAESLTSRMDSSLRKNLKAVGPELYERYGHLNVDMLLDHLEKNNAPSRKDIVALASSAQNYVRAVDNSLLCEAIRLENALERIAKHEIARELLKKGEKGLEILWGKDVEARARRINAILQNVGFTPCEGIFPTHLPSSFAQDFARLPTADAAKNFLVNADNI